MGGLGLVNPMELASPENTASIKVTAPLVEQIVSQAHASPDGNTVRSLQQEAHKEKEQRLSGNLEEVKSDLPYRSKRAIVIYILIV